MKKTMDFLQSKLKLNRFSTRSIYFFLRNTFCVISYPFFMVFFPGIRRFPISRPRWLMPIVGGMAWSQRPGLHPSLYATWSLIVRSDYPRKVKQKKLMGWIFDFMFFFFGGSILRWQKPLFVSWICELRWVFLSPVGDWWSAAETWVD